MGRWHRRARHFASLVKRGILIPEKNMRGASAYRLAVPPRTVLLAAEDNKSAEDVYDEMEYQVEAIEKEERRKKLWQARREKKALREAQAHDRRNPAQANQRPDTVAAYLKYHAKQMHEACGKIDKRALDSLVVQDCCKHWDQFYAMDLLGRLKKSGEYAQIIQEATESTPPTGQSE